MAMNGDYKWEEFDEYTVAVSPETSPTTPANFIDLGKVTINMARVISVKEYYDPAIGTIVTNRLVINDGSFAFIYVKTSLAKFISELPSNTP